MFSTVSKSAVCVERRDCACCVDGDDTRGVPLQLNQGLMDAASSIEDDPVPRREFHENGGPLFSIDPAGPSNTDATFENGMGVGQPPAEGYTGSLGDGLKFITDAGED